MFFRTGLADGEPSAPLSWNNASQLMEQPNGNRTKTFTALAKLRLTRRATLSGMGGGDWGVGGGSAERKIPSIRDHLYQCWTGECIAQVL